jgi:prephenate dehydratase
MKATSQPSKAGKQPFTAAFQGELGAFSQQAILQMLGPQAQPVPQPWFDDVFHSLERGEVDAAVIPIENTLHGTVQNYDLLLKHDFVITAETNVRIVHNLIAPPGVTFSQLRKVYSHPVALNQCLDFFATNKQIEQETFYDTAGSVKMVMEQRPPKAAAIAGELAAKIYKGNILKRGLEDDRENYTRFFLLEPAGSPPRFATKKAPSAKTKKPRSDKGAGSEGWKTSLVFTTRNIPGALFRAISAVALRDLNITKIESRPLRGKPWEYLFYLDFLGRAEDAVVQNALGHLGEVADFLRVLGTYRAF